jgi:hypothetical protein
MIAICLDLETGTFDEIPWLPQTIRREPARHVALIRSLRPNPRNLGQLFQITRDCAMCSVKFVGVVTQLRGKKQRLLYDIVKNALQVVIVARYAHLSSRDNYINSIILY